MKVKGFSIFEVLISVACLAIIFGISVPSYHVLQVRNDLHDSTVTYVNNLRRAQALARASHGDIGWSVRVATGSILIYKGLNYGARDTAFDETTSIPSSISITGVTNVSFSKFHGLPSVTGTTTFTSIRNETKSVSINAKGTINY